MKKDRLAIRRKEVRKEESRAEQTDKKTGRQEGSR